MIEKNQAICLFCKERVVSQRGEPDMCKCRAVRVFGLDQYLGREANSLHDWIETSVVSGKVSRLFHHRTQGYRLQEVS